MRIGIGGGQGRVGIWALAASFLALGALGLFGVILRPAAAQAPGDLFYLPPDSEVDDGDDFVIPADSDVIGFPPGGGGGVVTDGGPTVASLQARCDGTPPPGWDWLTVGPGDVLKVRTGMAVRFKAIPAGGQWTPNEPTWKFWLGYYHWVPYPPPGHYEPTIITYYGPGERAQGGWLASTGAGDYRWAEASLNGTSKRANVLAGPCDYRLVSDAGGGWEQRSLWWCAVGEERVFRAEIVPPPGWFDWSPGLQVKYSWGAGMDAETADPPEGQYAPTGTCSTREATTSDASNPFTVGGTAHLEYEPIWWYNSGLSSQVRAFYTDLMVDGVPGEQEEDPGCYIQKDGARRGVYLQAVSPGGMPGSMVLDVAEGADKVEVYEVETGGTPVTLPVEYPADTAKDVWVQGVSESGGQRDVEVTLTYARDGSTYTDRAMFTVVSLGHIQCEGQNVEDSAIVLLCGTIYTFTAVPDPEGALWPDGMPVWSGDFGGGSGEQKEITFSSACEGDHLTATCGNSKTVTVDVIVPEISEVQFTNAGSATCYDIYDGEDKWVNGGVNDPGCFKQGGKTAVNVKFSHTKSLTFSVGVQVKGNVNWQAHLVTGVHYAPAQGTFGASWPATICGVLSEEDTIAKVTYHNHVNVQWEYEVPAPSGTEGWIGAGSTDDLVYYLIWDAPKNGSPNTTVGAEAWADEHFTKAHLLRWPQFSLQWRMALRLRRSARIPHGSSA